MFLDHVPRWQQARRQAFVDWLHRGGTVHLLQDADSQYPTFSDELAVLNDPLEVTRVGAGYVFRHPRRRSDLNAKFAEDANNSREAHLYSIDRKFESDAVAAEDTSNSEDDYNTYSYGQWYNDASLFTPLKQMTFPDHNWVLIHLLSIAYILLIFPCGYLISFRRFDFRLSYAALFGVIVLFSVIFAAVGRRGYGEATAVHSVAIARPVGNGHLDVTAWSNLFVTDGDDYAITYPGTGSLFSTAQSNEKVNGIINNGPKGSFLVDIPPFSSRTLTHRLKIQQQPIDVTVDTFQAGDRLEELVIRLPQWLLKSTPLKVFALHRDRIVELDPHGEQFQLGKHSESLATFLPDTNEHQMHMFPGFSDDGKTAQQRFDELLKPVLARSIGVSKQDDILSFSLPNERVRLFVYAPMTPVFFTDNDRFRKQQGRVLYCIDLFAPENP